MKNKFNPLLQDNIQKIANTLLNFYDATVGEGGDYPNHAEAFANGKRVVKQISDVVEVTSPAITGDYYIEGNNYQLICDYQLIANALGKRGITGNIQFNNLTIKSDYQDELNSLFIGADKLILKNCKLNHTCNLFFYVNNLIAEFCDFTFPDKSIEHSILKLGKFNNCNFTGNNKSEPYQHIFRNINNTSFTNCAFSGAYRYTEIIGNNLSFENCKNTTSDKIEITCNNIYVFSFCENFSIVVFGGIVPKISNCNLILIRIGEQVEIGNITNSLVWFKTINGYNTNVINRTNIINSDVVFLENNGTVINFKEEFKITNGSISQYLLGATSSNGFMAYVFFYGGAVFNVIAFLHDLYIEIDNITITNSWIYDNILISNKASKTILKNNRMRGEIRDAGIDSEIDSNIERI